jgi:hypothetical protein
MIPCLYLKEPNRRHLHTHVYCSTIHNSQVVELAYVPISGWMVEDNVEYAQ